MKLELKYYPQKKNYSCGPASLKMVFEHLGKKYSEDKIISLCKTIPKTGTTHTHLIEEVKREKLKFIEKDKGTIKQLIKSLDNGYPIIINYCNPISKEGHYAVVIGYDKKEKILIFADPSNGNDYTLHWREFKSLWHNTNNSSKGWFLIIGREKINDI